MEQKNILKEYKIYPLGDAAIVVHFGNSIEIETHYKVKALADYLEEHPFQGMIEYLPTYTTVTVYFDPFEVHVLNKHQPAFSVVSTILERVLTTLELKIDKNPRTVEIPVCYGGDFGPDLEYVAEHNRLTPEEVISIHSGNEYLVYMIGFAPGFPYLGGMSEDIATPRKQSPRLAIPAGSVGIAGMQTGVYPIETPGGWQLIGRTPLELFKAKENPPSLLRAGDVIRFKPISYAEFENWKED